MRRDILNISFPPDLRQKVDAAVAKGLYASRSEFFRNLMRFWEEDEILRELRESQIEIARGKGKALRSLKDLR